MIIMTITTNSCKTRLWSFSLNQFTPPLQSVQSRYPQALNPEPYTFQVVYVSLGTGMSVFAAFLTHNLAPLSAGSGIAELKAALGGTKIPNLFSAWTLIVKSAGLVLSVGSGLSIGKEGPMVHICSCIGALCCRLFTKFRVNRWPLNLTPRTLNSTTQNPKH